MTRSDLLRRIRLGEDSTLELKAMRFHGGRVAEPQKDALADEMAAFANAGGGTVVLGVSDETRKVEGIPCECLDDVKAWLHGICHDSIKPALDADIIKMELPGIEEEPTPVVRIEILRSLFVHKSPGGYFRRIGSGKREMAPERLARIFQQRSQTGMIRFDESVVPRTSPDDLHYSLTHRFLEGEVEDAHSGPDDVSSSASGRCSKRWRTRWRIATTQWSALGFAFTCSETASSCTCPADS